MNATRKRAREEETTDREKTQLRALLGALSWHAQQVAPHVAAEVSILLSEVTKSTVDTIVRANILLQHTKARKDHTLRIHRFGPQESLRMYAWVDAANQNRKDGGSTQGILVGLGPESMMQGEIGAISLMAWHSSKIDRACRSPGAAETQAAVNGEDALYFARYQWGELMHGAPDVHDPDSLVRRIPGCLITDARNVYDKLKTEVLTIKGAEKRSNIELISLKSSQHTTGLDIRWVHSEAQLANGLTKAGSGKELELFYRMKQAWRIVEDDQMRSARRRKTQGMEPLEQSISNMSNRGKGTGDNIEQSPRSGTGAGPMQANSA